jgi:predicted O-methyltransferase YrrM
VLRRDKSIIYVKDLGAGSSVRNGITRQVGSFVSNASVNRKSGRFLSRLVNFLNPSSIIELGTGAGLSTLYMAIARPLCRIYSIEGSPDIADFAARNLEMAGINNVKIIKGSFRNKLPEVLLQAQHPLLVFIDGDHRGECLIEYYKIIQPRTDENTVIVLDDIRWSASMEDAWKKIIKASEVSVSIDLFRFGILFFKKGINKRHLIIKF